MTKKVTLYYYRFSLIVAALSCTQIHAELITTPKNIAVVAGSQCTIPCQNDIPKHAILWYYREPYSISLDFEWLYNGFKFAPKFVTKFAVNENKQGKCDIVIERAEPSHAGTYRCVESVNFISADSEVVVLASDPICHSTVAPGGTEMSCSVNYSGNWAPTMTWKTDDGFVIENGVSNVTIPNKSVTYSIHVRDMSAVRYYCTTYFNESNRPQGVNATNIPGYTHTSTSPFPVSNGTRVSPNYDTARHTSTITTRYEQPASSSSPVIIYSVVGVGLLIVGAVVASLLCICIRRIRKEPCASELQDPSANRSNTYRGIETRPSRGQQVAYLGADGTVYAQLALQQKALKPMRRSLSSRLLMRNKTSIYAETITTSQRTEIRQKCADCPITMITQSRERNTNLLMKREPPKKILER